MFKKALKNLVLALTITTLTSTLFLTPVSAATSQNSKNQTTSSSKAAMVDSLKPILKFISDNKITAIDYYIVNEPGSNCTLQFYLRGTKIPVFQKTLPFYGFLVRSVLCLEIIKLEKDGFPKGFVKFKGYVQK